jgi:hypothetical protein
MTVTVGDMAPMAGAKLWGFLEKAKKVRLATVLDDGPVVISPAWFVVKDETVYVALDPHIGDPIRAATPDATHISSVAAGARVSAVVDEGEGMDDLRAARISGRAEIVTDADLIEELLDLSAEKYFHVGHPHLEHYFSAGAVADRRWCRLLPDQMEGWDLRELPQPPVADLLTFPAHVREPQA